MSGPHDHAIRVWNKVGAGSWPSLGTIAAYNDLFWSVFERNGHVISGSSDKKIIVHSIASRQRA